MKITIGKWPAIVEKSNEQTIVSFDGEMGAVVSAKTEQGAYIKFIEAMRLYDIMKLFLTKMNVKNEKR